jgi:hypothetical protein
MTFYAGKSQSSRQNRIIASFVRIKRQDQQKNENAGKFQKKNFSLLTGGGSIIM